MCEPAGGSTIRDRLVEWFFKNFWDSYVTFKKVSLREVEG